MKMTKVTVWVLFIIFQVLFSGNAQSIKREDKINDQGVIEYDRKSVIVNGERLLIISGAVHYPRATPDMWPGILKESKNAGINCIETYVFWEGHEREEGKYDFSDRFDLPLFLELCKKEGLYVILRVGPYICAEWNYGGLPWWMAVKCGLVTRTWNKPFMDAMERWVMELGRRVNRYLVTNGGPILFVQMENEYNNVAKRYGADGQRYLSWAEELGRKAGFNVPMLMCEGASEKSIETLNGTSVWKRVGPLHVEKPDQPALWTENWVGWYDTWGYEHHTRDAREICTEVMRFFAVGGSGVNYYMWFGGTNFGRTAMYLQTTSYDYDAPVDEYGMPTEKLERIKILNQWLLKNQQIILEGEHLPVETIKDGVKNIAEVRGITLKNEEIVFVFSEVDYLVNVVVRGTPLSLPAGAGAILRKSGYSYKLEYHSYDTPARTVNLKLIPSEIRFSWLSLSDFPGNSGNLQFKPVTLPHNMIKETRDETDYGWYRTSFETDLQGKVILSARVSDRLSVWIDGEYAGSVPDRLPEDRKLSKPYSPMDNNPKTFSLQLPIVLTPGKHDLLLLVSALGMVKGDWMLDLPQSEERKGLLSGVFLNGIEIQGSWVFTSGLSGEKMRYFDPAHSDAFPWEAISMKKPFSWYKSGFSLSVNQIAGDPWMLEAEGLGKGLIWINGKCIGRYWQENGPQKYYHVPRAWLKPGNNELIIFEEQDCLPDNISLLRRHISY